MYSFEGLAGGGSGGGGADAKNGRKFLPRVFPISPPTVASAIVTASARTTTLMYFVRRERFSGVDFLREGIFFLPIENLFLSKASIWLVKQSRRACSHDLLQTQ
jgi:hypothetical protein